MRLAPATTIFLLSIGCASADLVTLNSSVEEISLIGKGADALGNGVSVVVPSRCTSTSAQTVCILSGRYTTATTAGIYTFTYQYAGNGAAPLIATTTPSSGEVFGLTVLAGTLTLNLKPDGSSASNFYDFPAQFLLAPARCFATPTCTTSYSGRLQGSVIVGTVSGTIDVTPTIASVSTATAFGGSSAIAPGTFVEIYGTNLATTLGQVATAADFTGTQAPVTLGGTSVTVAGQRASVQFVSPHQVNIQAPLSVGPGTALIQVTTSGGSSAAIPVQLHVVEPSILAPVGLKIGNFQYAFALFPDNVTLVLPPGAIPGVLSRSAKPGETVVLYGIGFGPVVSDTTPSIGGQGQNTLATFQAVLGGQPVGYSYAGLAPGFIGLYQFNLVIPQIPPNDATPFSFSVGGAFGTQTLYIAIGT